MIVVDTSVWIDALSRRDNAGTQRLYSIRPTKDIILGDLVLFKILQGARDDLNARRLERDLVQFGQRNMLDRIVAKRAAANYRLLRGLGITIRKSNDLIIGAYCIEHGHALLHNDRDFAPMAEHLGLIEY